MAEDLRVEVDKLRAFSRRLDELADASLTARSYASHTHPGGYAEGALLNRFLNGVKDVEPSVRTLFKHLNALFDRSGEGIVASVHYYNTTDHEVAARADAARDDLQTKGKP